VWHLRTNRIVARPCACFFSEGVKRFFDGFRHSLASGASAANRQQAFRACFPLRPDDKPDRRGEPLRSVQPEVFHEIVDPAKRD